MRFDRTIIYYRTSVTSRVIPTRATVEKQSGREAANFQLIIANTHYTDDSDIFVYRFHHRKIKL